MYIHEGEGCVMPEAKKLKDHIQGYEQGDMYKLALILWLMSNISWEALMALATDQSEKACK